MTKFPQYIEPEQIRPESHESIERKVEALLAAMTEEEIMDLCHGGDNPNGMQIANAGYNAGVPRLGVPEIRMYDGPAGVTSIHETTGLPVEEMLGSTWSPEMAYKYGKVEGSENFAVSGNTQLGSQYDVVRTPHFRRNKDMMGEDQFLTSRMAVAETRGIQDQHVSATLKHFAVATIDAVPGSAVDQIVDEQALHELHFLPFEAAIKEAGASSIMCSYNKFNGAYASANTYSQKEVLRDMWDFRGYMMSDWGANHELTTGKGMDMEMPNGAYNSNERIQKGIARGRITWDDVVNAARHVLYSMGMMGYLPFVEVGPDGKAAEEPGRTEPIKLRDRYDEAVKAGLLEENAAICREIAEKGSVLLKNDGALPLTPADCTGGNSVAMLGLGAVTLFSGSGQERSYGQISRMKAPADELKKLAGPGANIDAEIGLEYFGEAIPAGCFFTDENCTQPGLVRTYGVDETNKLPSRFPAPDPDGKKDGKAPQAMGGAGFEFKGVASAEGDDIDDPIPFVPPWKNELAGEMSGHALGELCCIDAAVDFTTGSKNYLNSAGGTAFPRGSIYTWDGFLKVPADGEYTLMLQAIGGNTVFTMKLDGRSVTVGSTSMRESSQWPWGSLVCTPEGMEVHGGTVRLKAGAAYPIRLCANASVALKDLQVRLAWITPEKKKESYDRALAAAAKAEKVVFFLTENYDFAPVGAPGGIIRGGLPSMEVPKAQADFLRDVKAAMKPESKLVVVHNNGQLYAMGSFEPLANAILNIWTPGQEGGSVTAELLTGRLNPSGKTVLTVPARDEDTLATDTPEHRTSRYLGVQEDGRTVVHYDEGIFSGYRWYDVSGVKPLYAFGHGLSYTAFEYGDLSVNGREVSFTVKNTGAVAGTEVAQVYLGEGAVPQGIQMAKKQLCGFARVEDIAPGETRRVTVTVPGRSFLYWDPSRELETYPDGSKGKWVETKGPRKVFVGGASDRLMLAGEME